MISADPHVGQAPGRLASVQAFVNSRDVEQSADDLTSPAALDRWLAAAGLRPDSSAPSGPADLALALKLRETLRAVLRSHVRRPSRSDSAHRDTAAAAGRLREIAASLQAAITADADGGVRVVAGPDGTRGALATLLLTAAEARTLGTWRRLKVCSADDCEWAFYDRSPTRSGCWCSMQVCGSRAKSRAYRSRATRRTDASRPQSSSPGVRASQSART